MIALIGLGNPGSEYEKTRHNVGFMVLDQITNDFKPEKKFNADIATTEVHGQKVLLAKPTTFMNLSGEAVQAILQFYKIDPQNTWVIYDDIDLPLGQIRIRPDGGPGTHNGMKSIVQYIGQDFPRIRIGIESRGITAPQQQDTSSFVLSQFTGEEQQQLEEVLRKTSKAIELWLTEGLEAAMNQYN